MANYMKCIAGVGNVEMSDAEHAARVADESEWESEKPARAFEGLRSERDLKLVATDFYALSDVTMSDEMTLYRDQLRKLPNGLNDETVLNFTWPTKP
jgi:hypothetical protein